MTYKIAICDDSGEDRAYVSGMAARWAASRGHAVHIDAFPSAGTCPRRNFCCTLPR